MISDLAALRSITRIPLPEDDTYLYTLGIAVYGFNYLTNFLCEVITYLDPQIKRNSFESSTAGDVLVLFNKARTKIDDPGLNMFASRVATAYEELIHKRNDIIHANPITSRDGTQLLYRSKAKLAKHFEVTELFVLDFCGLLDAVIDDLEKLRSGTRIT